MGKLRLEITKGEEIRYISHLDYASAMERAVIRAKLPAAYSEGFNPHMKLSFASALAVGVTSQAEYMDIEFKEDVDLKKGIQQLTAVLPPGIEVKSGKYVPTNAPALMALVNLATYDVIVPVNKVQDIGTLEESIRLFNKAQEILYTRQTPKGRKEIEAKQYIAKDICLSQLDNEIKLVIDIKITPTGSIKPGEILDILVSMFDFVIDKDKALINRTGLYVVKNENRVKPIDL